MLKQIAVALLVLAASCARPPAAPLAAGPNTCQECHAAAVEHFSKTGMGRSFRPTSADDQETPAWKHDASDTWFRYVRRDGALYHRRWQLDAQGREENAEELRADYVMGSGRKVRTFLHRTQRNTLIELPLARYADGRLALNPGFDTAAPPLRRRIGFDCMFCHNANIALPAAQQEAFAEPVFPATLPAGINCERCHGDATAHLRAARQPKPSPADLRRTIVNPARLPAERSMDVCMQCHLETTSFPLPNIVRRFERGPFSYRAGEPLTDFAHYFDHAPGTGHQDKFEIVSSAYRLRQAPCFLKSKGALTCTRCHHPHRAAADPQQQQHYNNVCRDCHASLPAKHPAQTECTTCHMPKRRAEDVVHAIMTDHRIARPTSVNLLAPLAEKHGAAARYQGRVAPYYPATADPLYLPAAQLIAGSNPRQGIAEMQATLRSQPARWEFHVILGDALSGELAAAQYAKALEQRPQSSVLLRRLAKAQPSETVLTQATQADPHDAAAWYDLGVFQRNHGRSAVALTALRRAAQEDPDSPEIASTLGAALAETGDAAGAESAFRTALRLDPYAPDAPANLGTLLAAQGRTAEALHQFERALRTGSATAQTRFNSSALTRFNYGVVLAQSKRWPEAERELQAALQLDPQMAAAHHILGGILLQKGDTPGAIRAYRQALRVQPTLAKAHLDLGLLLLAQGQVEGVQHLKSAAAAEDAAVRAEAQSVLAGLPK